MTRFFVSIILAFTTICANAYSVKEIPNVHVQNSTRYVSNPDGILSPQAEAQADSILANIWRQTSAEVVAVVVNEIDNGDIDTFATELFSEWGIGKKDNSNGLLVLIVKGMRKATLRTGYGMEGVIPDIIAGRIIRDNMASHFKEGDYDAGTIDALSRISEIITTPGATEELMSKYKNDAKAEDDQFFKNWLIISLVLTAVMFGVFIFTLVSNRKKDRYDKYCALNKLKLPMLMATVGGIGIPAIVLILLLWTMRRLRTKTRRCPNCNHKMKRLDEDEDNKYLTPAQDTEERLNSVDYDVWLCPRCGETDILPFVKATTYTTCSLCGAKACSLTNDRIIMQASVARDGRGIKEYTCHNCRHINQVAYIIPKLPPVIIAGGGGGRGFGGGGGFSGGSFGGGFTGGGGASGGW